MPRVCTARRFDRDGELDGCRAPVDGAVDVVGGRGRQREQSDPSRPGLNREPCEPRLCVVGESGAHDGDDQVPAFGGAEASAALAVRERGCVRGPDAHDRPVIDAGRQVVRSGARAQQPFEGPMLFGVGMRRD